MFSLESIHQLRIPKYPKQLWQQLPSNKDDTVQMSRYYFGLMLKAQATGDETYPLIIETMLHIQYRCLKLKLYEDSEETEFIQAYEKALPMMKWEVDSDHQIADVTTPFNKVKIVDPEPSDVVQTPLKIKEKVKNESSLVCCNAKCHSESDNEVIKTVEITESPNTVHVVDLPSSSLQEDIPQKEGKKGKRIGKGAYQRKIDRWQRKLLDGGVSRDDGLAPFGIIPRTRSRSKSKTYGTFSKKRNAFGGFYDLGRISCHELKEKVRDHSWSVSVNAAHNMKYGKMKYLSDDNHSHLTLLYYATGCPVMFGDDFSLLRPPEQDDRKVIFHCTVV